MKKLDKSNPVSDVSIWKDEVSGWVMDIRFKNREFFRKTFNDVYGPDLMGKRPNYNALIHRAVHYITEQKGWLLGCCPYIEV